MDGKNCQSAKPSIATAKAAYLAVLEFAELDPERIIIEGNLLNVLGVIQLKELTTDWKRAP